MKTLLSIALMVLTFFASAQTRRIAHRVHSGTTHERYDGRDGNYGNPYPYRVLVHLESGRDTVVDAWDSLASPKYLRYLDTVPHAILYPRDTRPKQDIREMGGITHRLIVKP
jgi:hypothetical protein